YSYGALHGCALGLITLALLVKSVEKAESSYRPSAKQNQKGGSKQSNSTAYLILAGVVAALTVLAKTEMGLAALAAGITAAALFGYPNIRRATGLVAMFLLPVIVIVAGVYCLIATQVGWHTLSEESFLFLRNLSPELVYFNKRVSGFDQPWQSFIQMIGATLRVALLAIIIATISLLFTRGKKEPTGRQI